MVCCIPVTESGSEKAARAAGDKKVEMLPMKELLPVTGYVRGGCSPIGMKKRFPTYLDKSAGEYEKIAVSAGMRGVQVILSPADLGRYVGAEMADLM
ncbi:MAG: YbaK/EbsC family protein [Clostridium sp.]